jgi:hypothetical protein
LSSTGSTSDDSTKERLLLVTGRKHGGIQVWDASTPSIVLLCTVNAQVNVRYTYDEIAVNNYGYLIFTAMKNIWSLSLTSLRKIFDAAHSNSVLTQRIMFFADQAGSSLCLSCGPE